ncbi:MAG: hypothetical protein FIA94_13520 [Nitrospirae bacterium]|nr:hypothetical protein [Nitrospirota bacterium]
MKKKKKLSKKKPEAPVIFANQPFRNLDILFRNAVTETEQSVPEGNTPVDKNDDEFFFEAMRDVQEIRAFREIKVPARPAASISKRMKNLNEGRAELEGIVNGKQQIRLSDTQEYVEWVNPLYGREIVRELHQGRYAVQDSIDLHGFILGQAEEALRTFLAEARRRGFRCVKIVHGRGLRSPNGPVLKHAVTALLSSRYRKRIIGFSTARSNDGGLGALYVLLA